MLRADRFDDQEISGASGISAKIHGTRTMACLFALTLLTGNWANAGNDGNSGGWQSNFESAEALAKAQNVPMVVHFHAHWCGPCRVMETEVLSSADVNAALGVGIIGVKINSDERKDLVSRFGITALPTDVIVSPDGRILSKDVGSPGKSGYIARLLRFTAPASRSTDNRDTQVAQAADTSGNPGARVASQSTNSEVPVAAADRTAEKPSPDSVSVDRTNDIELAAATSVDSNDKVVSHSVASSESPTLSDTAEKAMTQALRRELDKQIGLHGFSPVSLTESEQWKTGATQFKYEFQGVCYLLTSADELNRFKASPDRFIPALHGCDPVSLMNDQIVQAGHIELGVTYRSKVYFFFSKQTRDEFLSNPEKFSRTNKLTFLQQETEG